MSPFPRSAVCFALALAACGGSSGNGGGFGDGDSEVAVAISPAFEGVSFTRPLKLVQHPTDADRWYVLEQGGGIWTFDASVSPIVPDLVVDVSDTVDLGNTGGSEQGLLGLAFAPGFDDVDGGEIYLTYTDDAAQQVVLARWTSDDGVDDFAPAADPVLLAVDHPETNHNGGEVLFGPDGYLYVSLGDGGGSGNRENAQDTTNLLGAVLRIDVEGEPAPGEPYAIPDDGDNPFAGMGHALCGDGGTSPDDDPCPEIFAWGLRNPWRMSFDSQTGDLWAGDVGESRREEVDRIVSDGNYAWPCLEGDLQLDFDASCAGVAFQDPEAVHGRGEAGSIIGGVVARGSAIAELEGHYVYGDFIEGNLFGLDADDPLAEPVALSGSVANITAFARARDGALYVVAFSSPSIRTIVAPPAP